MTCAAEMAEKAEAKEQKRAAGVKLKYSGI